ncbi:hypothetical protein N431DRAFT_487162 [Stipitochalara longipes BDJ]|nr:hypothetical protein N431DRAFT_487162 [Stipitochalara longipes BDJ]
MEDQKMLLEGYAYSGEGRKTVKVDVSTNNEDTWDQAALLDDEMLSGYDPYVPPPDGYRIDTSSGVRANRAPAHVIHRAIMYAASYNFRFLWIDQESINQDDLREKSEAIQQMNLIYQQAAQTIALLNNPIMEQAHLDAIKRIGIDPGMHSASDGEPHYHKDPLHRGRLQSLLVEFAEIIAGDPWYFRAWTLHERFVAGGPLHFLIPCHQELEIPSWTEIATPGNIILSESFIMNCIGPLLWLPEWSDLGHSHFYELERGKRDLLVLVNAPTYKFNGDMVRRPELARLCAADACSSLFHRGISEPFDILTIIANICQYDTRLDPYCIRDAGISLSIAIWAQALLNGDMSLLMALNAKGLASRNATFEFCQLTDPFVKALAGPAIDADFSNYMQPTAISSSNSWVCRIKPIRASPVGVKITGTLWQFNSWIDFSDMPGMSTPYAEWKRVAYKVGNPLWEDTFSKILAHLESNGRLDPLCSESKLQIRTENSCSLVREIVDMVMRSRKIAVGIRESDAEECSTHEPTYILFEKEAPAALLFVPRRDLVMSESASDTPLFLFLCWVCKRERRGTMFDLSLLDFPRKVDLVSGEDLAQRDMLVCGSLRHFSSCAGKEYNLLWKSETLTPESCESPRIMTLEKEMDAPGL